MKEKVLECDARVMSKGQVTIPKKIRKILNIEPGDRVTFIVDGKNVRVVNSLFYALNMIQDQMKGEAEKTGLLSENEIDEWIAKSRSEKSNQSPHG